MELMELYVGAGLREERERTSCSVCEIDRSAILGNGFWLYPHFLRSWFVCDMSAYFLLSHFLWASNFDGLPGTFVMLTQPIKAI